MKKYLLGLVAVVLAVGFSACKKQSPEKETTNTVFHFKGTSVSYDQITNTANWELSGSESCNGSTLTCQMSTADASTVQGLVNYISINFSSDPSAGEDYVLDRTISQKD